MTANPSESATGELSNSQLRDQASQVLEDPDFQQYLNEGEHFDPWGWLKDFMRWLKSLFDWELPVEHGDHSDIWTAFGWAMKGLIWLVIAGIVLYVGYRLVRHFFFKPKEETFEIAGVSQQQRVEAQELYLKLAGDALAEKDYRRAIHYLFLATVSLVIRDAKFHASEFMTNREIAGSTDFSKFANGQQLGGLFNDMVYYDEPRWFGKFSISEADYQHFQQMYSQFHQQLRS